MWLDSCGVGMEGVRHLLRLAQRVRLVSLSLTDNDVGAEGGKLLEEALRGGRLRGLRRLRVEANEMGEQACSALRRAVAALNRELAAELGGDDSAVHETRGPRVRTDAGDPDLWDQGSIGGGVASAGSRSSAAPAEGAGAVMRLECD